MKKMLMPSILSGFFLSAGILFAGQLIIFNKTKKPIGFSLKFFHNQAKQEMVIGDFNLGPNQKTSFPQSKDLHLAHPIKLKVYNKEANSSTSMSFDKNDPSVHNISIEKHNGRLKLSAFSERKQKS